MSIAPRKKLIEVALPLEAINRESAREKSIRHGHPSTLHLWWARRPLAACRAVLFSSLVDDPSSDPRYRRPDGSIDEEAAGAKRAELFSLIEELVKWENSSNPKVIDAARAEIARCVASRRIELGELDKATIIHGRGKGEKHAEGPVPPHGSKQGGTTAWQLVVGQGKPEAVNAFLAEFAPPVLDPFCGGGSIPLEAQRLGLRAFASDLNPVPVLITKALIEIPPKFAGMPPVNPASHGAGDTTGSSAGKAKGRKTHTQAQLAVGGWKGAAGLAADVRYYGQWMCDEARRRIGHLYPKISITKKMADDRPDLKDYVGQELTAVVWLWGRTIKCPNPTCGARAPLVRSFVIASNEGERIHLQPLLDARTKSVRFKVRNDGEPQRHTTDKTGARCLFCNRFVRKAELREIATRDGIQIVPLAIVCETESERFYLASEDCSALHIPRPDVSFLEQPMPNDRRWFSPPLYGLPAFADLFTTRQLTALMTFSDLVLAAREQVLSDAIASRMAAELASEYATAVATYLGFAANKCADYWCTVATWMPRGTVGHAFSKQAIPMIWDFPEANPFAEFHCSWQTAVEWVSKVVARSTLPLVAGKVQQGNAERIDRVSGSTIVCTDPPYYDNIGYSDLSDFFYIWLRRSLGKAYGELFPTLLAPKSEELVASTYRHGGSRDVATKFFEIGLGNAFKRMHSAQHSEFPLTLYYAFKQAETDEEPEESGTDSGQTASTGWETMLEGLISAGFGITGTWPMRTEREARSIGIGTNALASSIVLVCHPRPDSAPMASRREFIAALKRDLPSALKDLQSGNIAPVDLAQAAIGPGMAVYSRYSKVLETSGERMGVRTALALINQVLDEVLAEQEGEYDPDTRWCIKWFESHAHDEGPFGEADVLARAMAVGVNGLQDTGVIAAKSGKVRLFRRTELMGGRPETWDPASDDDILHWEVCQYLIWALETGGEQAAADLLRRINAVYAGASDVARDLAYRLYTLCERKKWAQEAISYNSLIVAWPEIQKLAGRQSPAVAAQGELGF